MPEPDLATKLLKQLFEPGAVTTSFQADDHAPGELRVESAHFLFVLVFEFTDDEFASFSFQITDRLLSCMKVNADIYCVHSASSSLMSLSALAVSLSLTGGGACFITSVPPRG